MKKIGKHQLKSKNQIKNSDKKSTNYLNYLIPGIIIILTIFLYWNSLDNEFTNWDDGRDITDNILIKDFSIEGIKTIFTSSGSVYYCPLSLVSYSVNYHFWGLNPTPYHVTNLIFHVLNILLVFIFIRALTNNIKIAAFVSLFFAIHPMTVESVTWLTERKNVLYAFFYLCSLISYTMYLKNNLKVRYIIFCLLFFILSLLSKPSAVSLTFSLIAVDLFMKRKYDFKNILEKSIFLIFSVAFILILMNTHKLTNNGNNFDFTLIQNIFLAGYSFTFYIFMFFMPVNLNIIHPMPSSIGLLPILYYVYTFIGLIITATLITLAIKYKEHRHVILSGFFFFISSIVLFMHIIPYNYLTIAGERFSYIPNIGLLLITGYFLHVFWERKTNLRPILYASLLGVIIIFSVMVVHRNNVWQNNISIWNEALEKNKNFAIGYFNRGKAYKEMKEYQKAINDFDSVLKLDTNNPYAYTYRGATYAELQQFQKAFDDYDKALKIDNQNFKTYFNRGVLFARLQEFENAIDDFNNTIKLNPQNLEAYINRGNCWFYLGYTEKALHDYNSAISLKTNNGLAIFYRGLAYYKLNKQKEACEDWNYAYQLGLPQAKAYVLKLCK